MKTYAPQKIDIFALITGNNVEHSISTDFHKFYELNNKYLSNCWYNNHITISTAVCVLQLLSSKGLDNL